MKTKITQWKPKELKFKGSIHREDGWSDAEKQQFLNAVTTVIDSMFSDITEQSLEFEG